MRDVQEPLDGVTLDAAGRPLRFCYAGRWHPVVQQLDAWRFGGRWWLGEAPRDCFLVQTERLVAELHHEDLRGRDLRGRDLHGEDRPDHLSTGRWWLARMLD